MVPSLSITDPRYLKCSTLFNSSPFSLIGSGFSLVDRCSVFATLIFRPFSVKTFCHDSSLFWVSVLVTSIIARSSAYSTSHGSSFCISCGSLCLSLCLFVSSMIFLCFRLLSFLEYTLFPGYCLLDYCIPPPGLPFLHERSTSRDPAVLAALLFHCFRKDCPFRLFTIVHVVDDILGIVISYCLILKYPPFAHNFVLSPILYFLICSSPQIHHNKSVL